MSIAKRGGLFEDLVNSIVSNYLAALRSSRLPTNTSRGNIPHNCRAAARRYLKDKMSNPLCPNFSAVSPNASEHVEEKTSEPSFSLETCKKSVTALPIMHHPKYQLTLFVHLENDGPF